MAWSAAATAAIRISKKEAADKMIPADRPGSSVRRKNARAERILPSLLSWGIGAYARSLLGTMEAAKA